MTDPTVLDEVRAERARQEKLWGDQRARDLCEYIAILGEEFGEVCEAILENRFGGRSIQNARREAIEVAAVAAAIVEAIDFQFPRLRKDETRRTR